MMGLGMEQIFQQMQENPVLELTDDFGATPYPNNDTNYSNDKGVENFVHYRKIYYYSGILDYQD